MRPVIGLLNFTAPIGLVDGKLHGIRHNVGIHNDLAVYVAGRPSTGLNQRSGRAQETLFVCIQDRHQRDFGYVKAFTQKVDSHQHIKTAQSQVADNFDSFKCFNVGVKIAHPDRQIRIVFSQIFRHAFRQGRHQDSFIAVLVN